MQQIKAQHKLGSARTQASNKETDRRNVTGVVENVLQDDFRNGRTSDLLHLWETINREWLFSTLQNKAAYILEVLEKGKKKN